MPWLFRPLLWVRRCVWGAVRYAWWSFWRTLFGLSVWFLYSDASKPRSCFHRWVLSPRTGPPFGLFSIYQALRCGYPKVEGRIVLEDQGTPVVQPGSLLADGTTKQHITQPWPIVWSTHTEAHLVSESLALLMPDKQLAAESVYHRDYDTDPAVHYLRLPEPARLSGSWTSIISRWVPHRGRPNHSHWLLDALPRLALMNEFPANTNILVPAGLASYQKESLAMMGYGADRCRETPERHLVIDRYYFSGPTAMIVCYNPYAVAFLRRTFLSHADPAYRGPKRFFIRRNSPTRDIGNAAEVEAFFRDQGWEAIDVATLTFAQEIALFSQAEAVAGMLGSGMINLLFARPDCSVLALGHDYWTDGVLDWILQTVGVTNYVWHVSASDGCRRHSVEMPALRQAFLKLTRSQ